MMSGSIWTWDIYSLRKYRPGETDYFLDIGGCVGTASVFFKAHDPCAKVIAIEPCREDYETMLKVAGFWGVKCYHMALGDGRPLCFGRRWQGAHRFYTADEKQWWPEKPEYLVESKSLPQLMDYFNIKGRYIIKLDAEGGERFILNDRDSIEIIRSAVQFNMEYHRGFGGPQEQWHEWFRNFENTHNLFRRTRDRTDTGCVFVKSIGPTENWRSEYMLVKK